MGKRTLRTYEREQDTNSDLESDSDVDQHLALNSVSLHRSERPSDNEMLLKEKKKKKSGKRRRSRRDVFNRSRADLLFVHERNGTAASMENVLTQALISKDRVMLDSVLKIEDLLVIRLTISELPAQYIEEFCNQLVSRMQASPIRMRVLGPWMRELLRQRISSCVEVSSIRQSIARIYEHASVRLRFHQLTVKLQGELDTLAYLGYRRLEENETNKKPVEDPNKPLLSFKEGSDSVHNPANLVHALNYYSKKNLRNNTTDENEDKLFTHSEKEDNVDDFLFSHPEISYMS